MASRNPVELWRKFTATVREIALSSGREVTLRGSMEHAVVTLDNSSYLVLVETGATQISLERLDAMLRQQPSFEGSIPVGVIVLAPDAKLAAGLTDLPNLFDPLQVGVVGRWGSGNDLAATLIDIEMALLLVAAGVPESRILPLLKSATPEPSLRLEAGLPTRTSERASNGRALRPGHLIDAYRLEKRLGRGYSAEVWKATVVAPIHGVDLQEGQTVALKLYLPALVQGFETLRIQREFSVAADLRHPNLVRVFDLVLAPSRPHHAFLAMDFIDGPTLRAHIEAKGPLSPEVVLALAEQVFSALEEIHTHGALHRDVKAANILVAEHSERRITIKLVDLGIVSIPAEEKLTQASAFLGSKHSAPFEQLTGERLDERTDIYGAGSVLFHAITGRAMYHDAGPESAIAVRMLQRPEKLPMGAAVVSVVRDLHDFINACIAVKSSERPSTARECLSILRGLRARTA